MSDKEIFVLKIVRKKSIASLHRLTQAVQRDNLRCTAGDPTWVYYFETYFKGILQHLKLENSIFDVTNRVSV